MYLKEIACSSKGLSSYSHCWYKFTIANGFANSCTRTLNAMRTIHNNSWYNRFHIRNVTEVDY